MPWCCGIAAANSSNASRTANCFSHSEMNQPALNGPVMNRPQDEGTVLNRPVMNRPGIFARTVCPPLNKTMGYV